MSASDSVGQAEGPAYHEALMSIDQPSSGATTAAPPAAAWQKFVALPLIVLALPLFSIRLGFADDGNYPKKETVRRAYDLLGEGFGPGFNGPLVVLVQAPNGGTLSADLASLDTPLGRLAAGRA